MEVSAGSRKELHKASSPGWKRHCDSPRFKREVQQGAKDRQATVRKEEKENKEAALGEYTVASI